jgi:hypothetical protein
MGQRASLPVDIDCEASRVRVMTKVSTRLSCDRTAGNMERYECTLHKVPFWVVHACLGEFLANQAGLCWLRGLGKTMWANCGHQTRQID